MSATSLRRVTGLAILTVFFSIFFFSCSTHRSQIIGPSIAIKAEKAPEPETSPFVLGPGDEVSINVWRNDNLSKTVKIDPSGMVQLPLAGKIQAAGQTPAQLADLVIVRLSKYLVNPHVDINATTLRNHKVYIMGEVKSPGVIVLDHQILFWEALAQSGGFTNDANQQNVLLIRKDQDVINVSVLNLDITTQIIKGQFDMGSYLRDNDIVYVPTSSIADYTRFAQRLTSIINPILGIEQMIILAPQVADALKGMQQSGSIVVPH